MERRGADARPHRRGDVLAQHRPRAPRSSCAPRTSTAAARPRSCCANDDRIRAGRAVHRPHHRPSTSPSATTAAASRSSSSSAASSGSRASTSTRSSRKKLQVAARERAQHPARRPAGLRQDGARPLDRRRRWAWSSCSSTAARSSRRPTSWPPSRCARPRRGAPVTDFIKTEVLVALEEAAEHRDRRYLVFLDEFNRCQESARNALMPALDSTRKRLPPDREHVHPDPRQRAVHRRRQPRQRVLRHVRHRRRAARPLRAAADGLPAAERGGRDAPRAATRSCGRKIVEAGRRGRRRDPQGAGAAAARCRCAPPTRRASTSSTR